MNIDLSDLSVFSLVDDLGFVSIFCAPLTTCVKVDKLVQDGKDDETDSQSREEDDSRKRN